MEYSEVKEQIKQKLPVQKEFGDSENLLELGLSSIVIMRLVNQWRKQGVKVAFGTLMEHPTLKEWWKIIQKGTKKKGKKAKAEKRDIIMERDMRKPFPLTDVQYAYWVGREDNQVLGGIGCHAYLEFDGYGVVPERLQEAWSRIQYHHPMLRASFSENGMQKIESKPYSEKIKINDFSLLTETEAEQEAQAVRRRLSHRKLKIEEGEVAGLELTLLPGNKTRLHIDLDLLIADVQSLQILLRDLAMVYSGVELPEESKDWNFAAYLEQQNVEDREERKKAKEYWSARLKNLPQGPDMPLAKRPEEVKNPVFHRRVVRIGKEEWDCLQRRAKEYQTTPAMLLLTAYSAILERWSKNKSFLINIPFFNRKTEYKGLEDVIADFTTLLLLEINCEGNPTFLELLDRIQKQLHEDMKYTTYSGVQVQRDLTQMYGDISAIAPIVFACNLGTELVNSTFTENFGSFSYMISQTPQVWNDFQSYEDENGVQLTWDTIDELFPEDMIDDMLTSFEQLLHNLRKEDWNQRFDVLPERQKNFVRKECTIPAASEQKVLFQEFFENVERSPERIAIIDTGKELEISYSRLKEMAQRVAAGIIKRNIKEESIAITIPRGYEQIVAVLAVLISGNVYVPVSCEQPSERRKLIHEKTDIHYVITTAEKEKQIEWPENVEIWCVEKLLENELLENYPKIYPEDSAYIIMTSGSTGQPKGVEMSHANAWNTIEYINRKYCVDQTDAILAVSALDFDLSVYDQFGLLSAGGKIILIPESESKNPDYWLKMIFEYHITRWNSVPILGEMLFECWKAQKKEKIPFRTAFYSGDWTLLYMVDMFYEAVEDGTLIVLGGTTETGIWSNEQIVKLPLPENWKTIPYGRPLENQAYRVVDDFGRDCPFWVEGELWIGGEGVGKGYRGDEVLTKQKYIMDCFGRWYRTGDNGCFWNDGTIEYRGRRDFQVKVKGHRIELGEIEAILNKIAGVKKSIVCAVEHNNRKNMLVAVVVKESPNINEEFLMQNLKSKLPVYMLPKKIIFEDKLPVGKNAKQDRKEVVRWIKAHEDRNIENEEKLTPCETRMLKIWKRLLGNDNITKKDNYFVCGGDSLLAVRMTAEIEAEFGVKVSIGIIFENNTVESLAKRISSIKEKRKPNIEVVQHNEQERFQEFLTTEMQYAYWIGRQNVYALGNVSSYCYYEIVSKNLSIERLERAWNELIIENDALRLVFSKDGKRQKVLESVPYYNLKVYNTDLDGKETVESIRDDMSQQIMEASQWPLFDIRVSICQDKNIVHVGIDNLIMDARSVLSILYQWTQRYVGNNKSKLESVSFRDYVCAMNERNMLLKDQEYWESRISHFPAYPKIPTKKMPQEITKQVFKRYTKEMTKHKWELLKKIGEKQNITASNILLTAYALMLWEESGSNHFALNITIDKRWNLSKELRHTIGDFTGNILLEIKIDEKKTFIELAHEIQNQLMKDLEHSDFSGIKFQRELSKYDGKKFRYGIPFVYTSTLGMENENDNLFGEICYNITQTPQVWLDYQIQERQGALYLNWDYLQGLLDETQIENMIYKYSNLLDWLIENGDFLISEDNNYQEGIL